MPEVERSVYGSYVEVEGVVVYRNPVCTLPEAAATLWHADHHYDGVMKIMVYLNDVGERNAPFEYLRHAKTGALVRVRATHPPRYPGNRIPADMIAGYLADGYVRHKVIGPKGTFMLFDEKNIHKGNYAEEGARDALVLQFRPTLTRTERRIDPAWTKAMV